jgi:Gluconate 2-dehydrogenase subunit 3
MRRRAVIQALVSAPVIAAIPLPAQSPSQDIPKLATSNAEAVGDAITHFFSAPELAALRRLGDLVIPAASNRPGARDAKAAEFLDFLLAQSPAPRQELYRSGLDRLQSEARRRFKTTFEELTAEQVDTIVAPLHSAWTYSAPADPFARFLREAKEDLITATMNSREFIEAQTAAGRRGAGIGTYWYPVE